jgi:hypothetical protein
LIFKYENDLLILVVRWRTKNGKRIPIYDNKSVSSNLMETNSSDTIRWEPPKIPRALQKGWHTSIYRGKNYSIDIENFGVFRFSFSVWKEGHQVFCIPPSLLEFAIKSSVTLLGIPPIHMIPSHLLPTNLPWSVIRDAISCCQELTQK